MLYALVDPQGRLPRMNAKWNLACHIVLHLYEKYDSLEYIFLALDLNHIPCIDVSSMEAVAFMMEQHKVKQQLQQVLEEQVHVKAQLTSITEQLNRIRDEKRIAHQQVRPEAQVHVGSHRSDAQAGRSPRSHRVHDLNAHESHDSSRTWTNVVKQHASRHHDAKGFTKDFGVSVSKTTGSQEEGRTKSQRRGQTTMVTGIRSQRKLKPTINEIRIFATKFDPEESESDLKDYISELINDQCIV